MYNALIKDVTPTGTKGQITSRTFLKNLSQIPPTWTIFFRGSVINPRKTDIAKLMCTSNDPISVYKGGVSSPSKDKNARAAPVKTHISVKIKMSTGELEKYKIVTAKVKPTDNLGALRNIIAEFFPEIPRDYQVLFFRGASLNDQQPANNTLKNNGIQEGSVIWLSKKPDSSQFKTSEKSRSSQRKIMATPKITSPRPTATSRKMAAPKKLQVLQQKRMATPKEMPRRKKATPKVTPRRKMATPRDRAQKSVTRPPSSSFKAQNVEKPKIIKEGAVPIYNWNLYSFGMNLYGDCPNKQCPSKKGSVKDGVSFNAGYGEILLTPERYKFPCPACKLLPSRMAVADVLFPVKEFVVCAGRSLFRFKKSGVGEEVKTVVLESLEQDVMKYATFDAGKGRAAKADYDFIEITTVKADCSLYFCVKCDERIGKRGDEVILRCGHAYHSTCCGKRRITAVTLYDDGSESEISEEEEDDGGDCIEECVVCQVAEVQNIYDLLGGEEEEDGDSDSELALFRQIDG